MAFSLMNGLSAAGGGLADYAEKTGLLGQRAELERTQALLADQLHEASQARQFAHSSAEGELNRTATQRNALVSDALTARRQQESDERHAAAAAKEKQLDRDQRERLEGGPFPGNSDHATSARILESLSPKLKDGTITPEELRRYAIAESYFTKPGPLQTIQDPEFPNDPNRTKLASIPGKMPEGFLPSTYKPPDKSAPVKSDDVSGKPTDKDAPSSTQGTPSLIPGTAKGGSERAPATVVTGMLENAGAVRQIDTALGLLADPRLKGSVGAMAGAGNAISSYALDLADPDGITLRALIADIGSLKIHERSGAAVTVSESPRLAPFVPRIGDSPKSLGDKLAKFRTEYLNNLKDTYSVYGPESGGRKLDPVETALRNIEKPREEKKDNTAKPPSHPPLPEGFRVIQ